MQNKLHIKVRRREGTKARRGESTKERKREVNSCFRAFALYCFIALLLSFPTHAQTVFHDASAFPLLGKISDATETRYERLPTTLKEVSRPPVWALGKNTAGLAIRFCSDSRQISARWETLNDFSMNHMASTGIKGLDLYCLENGEWTYVNTARPTAKKSEAIIISDMEQKERELMLYLPLYEGIVSLEIGIDSSAFITQPKIDLPRRTKPIVAYGTSILQGGCASRPGMAHTNILSRMLNREIINLGFSGNGQLDYEIAGLMAECDASLYILDFMPNVTVEQIHEKAGKFYRILRDKRPDVPVIFIEEPIFPHTQYDLSLQNKVRKLNEALHTVFEGLKAEKEKNIRLIPSAGMIGTDGEATVDGIHFTDLGFMRYAEYLYPEIQKIRSVPAAEKEKSLWIDADANLQTFLVKENVGKYLDKAVATGFTKIILDVRPGSGYPMYPSQVLPELTKEKGFEFRRDWNYLQYFLDEAHRRNLKVTASITTFSGGRQPFKEGLVYDDPKWNGKSSVEYLPGKGLIDIKDSPSHHHVFMNPLDRDWQNLTLDLLREIAGYPVDGIALDYCRYANGGNADFSETSRTAFEKYLGKKLEHFPGDIFSYDEDGKRIPGIYYKDWWAFRAKNIHDFIQSARDLIKGINPGIELEYWAASWYNALHAHGQNWASRHHNTSKERPDFANEDYSKYGFAGLLDIFQSGAYLEIIWGANEPESIEAQLANSMRVVKNDCKVYGSVYAANQKTAKDISDAVFLCLRNTDGLSVFDIVQVIKYNLWDGIKEGIHRASETE